MVVTGMEHGLPMGSDRAKVGVGWGEPLMERKLPGLYNTSSASLLVEL